MSGSSLKGKVYEKLECTHPECAATGNNKFGGQQGLSRHNSAFLRRKKMEEAAKAYRGLPQSRQEAQPEEHSGEEEVKFGKYREARNGVDALRQMAAELDRGFVNVPQMAADLRIIATAISILYTDLTNLNVRTLERKARFWDAIVANLEEWVADFKSEED